MQKVNTLFGEFVEELKKKKNRKNLLRTAESLYRDIELNRNEIKCPTDLEELLRSTRTKKEKKRDIILMFYKFYEQKTGIKIETDLQSKIIVDNQLLRVYLILQYIQDNKMDLEIMSDVFMMSQKSIKKTLNSLEDGVEFKEIKVKIPMKKEDGTKFSVRSYHPIFLNLTMTEIVTMTAGLLELSKDETIYSPLLKKIAKDVYAQLTPYGKGNVTKVLKNKDLSEDLKREIDTYRGQISSSLMEMYKTGFDGDITVSCDDKEYCFLCCRVISYENDEVVIITKDNKEKIFKFHNIVNCNSHYDNRFENNIKLEEYEIN